MFWQCQTGTEPCTNQSATEHEARGVRPNEDGADAKEILGRRRLERIKPKRDVIHQSVSCLLSHWYCMATKQFTDLNSPRLNSPFSLSDPRLREPARNFLPFVLFDVVAGGRRLMQGVRLEAYGCSWQPGPKISWS
jgi:hypothetical protein